MKTPRELAHEFVGRHCKPHGDGRHEPACDRLTGDLEERDVEVRDAALREAINEAAHLGGKWRAEGNVIFALGADQVATALEALLSQPTETPPGTPPPTQEEP